MTDCEARLNIKLNKCSGKYFVNNFIEKHNHALVIPECTHMLPSKRKIYVVQVIEVELDE